MTILHACLFATYEVCKPLVEVWATKCSSMLVAEHPADGATKRIHCHIMIDHDMADDEPFRVSGKKVLGEFFKRGNYWIASRVQKGPYAGQLLEKDKVCIYILKGEHTAKFLKNISHEQLEGYLSAWVDSDKNDTPADDSSKHTERIITKIVAKIKDEFTYYDNNGDIDNEFNERALLTLVRHETFKQLYYQRRMFPHASHYKIVAGTVYMRLAEYYKCFDKAMKIISELWL